MEEAVVIINLNLTHQVAVFRQTLNNHLAVVVLMVIILHNNRYLHSNKTIIMVVAVVVEYTLVAIHLHPIITIIVADHPSSLIVLLNLIAVIVPVALIITFLVKEVNFNKVGLIIIIVITHSLQITIAATLADHQLSHSVMPLISNSLRTIQVAMVLVHWDILVIIIIMVVLAISIIVIRSHRIIIIPCQDLSLIQIVIHLVEAVVVIHLIMLVAAWVTMPPVTVASMSEETVSLAITMEVAEDLIAITKTKIQITITAVLIWEDKLHQAIGKTQEAVMMSCSQ